MPAGLNIATQPGEGSANILNWDHFDNTMQRIYQRDIYAQKAAQAQWSKMTMKLGDAAEKIRPADMPKFQEGYNKYKEAQLMLESSKIRNSPKDRAYWTSQAEQAYYDNMSLAEQSGQATKRQTDVWGEFAKDPNKFKSYDEMDLMNKLYDQSPVEQLNKLGLNTMTPWMHPANLYPAADFDKHVLGEPIQKEKRTPVVDQKTGLTKGYWVDQVQTYKKTPTQLANDMAFGLQHIWDVSQDWKKKYDYDVQNQPDVIDKTVQDANAILAADPKSEGKRLDPTKWGDYAAASYILQAQPRDVGDKKYEVSPEWQEHEKDVDRMQQQAFLKGMAGLQHGYRMAERQYSSWLQFKKSNSLNFSGQEMYDAALHPSQTYVLKDGKTETKLEGRQLLDKRMAEIMSKVPKNYDYVILNRYNVLNMAQRRRILEKLGVNATSPLYYLEKSGKTNDQVVQQFLDFLNAAPDPNGGGGMGMHINMNDLATSTPVILNKDNGAKTPVSLSTHNYDQFVSKISQLLQQEKPAGSISDDDEDGSIDIINSLNQYVNPPQR